MTRGCRRNGPRATSSSDSSIFPFREMHTRRDDGLASPPTDGATSRLAFFSPFVPDQGKKTNSKGDHQARWRLTNQSTVGERVGKQKFSTNGFLVPLFTARTRD